MYFVLCIISDPPIPYIKHHDFIKTVFPEDYSNILWLYAAHTFPLFCSLLELPEYTERVMIGLIASIGQLTESLVCFGQRICSIKLACFQHAQFCGYIISMIDYLYNYCLFFFAQFQVKYSSEALTTFLREHSEHEKRICDTIIDIFNKNSLNERISCPLLNFLNIIIGSGIIDDIVLDPTAKFSSEIYRLTKLEIKGHKKLYKLVSSISVFCQLIQVWEI